MTIITTASAVAWAPQVSAGTDDGTAAGASNSKLPAINYKHWRWIPATGITMATQQDQRPLPPELAGVPLPRGVYKSGAWVEGGVEFIPRAVGSHLHWLLWSACGSMSVRAITQASNHCWDYYYGGGNSFSADNTGDATNLDDKYLAVKRLLPPDETGLYRGEAFSDCRVSAMEFAMGVGSPLAATVGFQGRVPKFYAGATVSPAGALANEWNPAYRLVTAGNHIPGLQNAENYFLSCKGSMNLPTGSPLDISSTGISLQVVPQLTDSQAQRIMFSYHPEAARVTNWAVGVRMTVKKGVYDLYDQIFFGGDAGMWSPVPWMNGMPFKFTIKTASDTLIDSTWPGEFEFWASDIIWSMQPITVAPNQILGAIITGVVLAPSDGKEGWYIRIRNDRDPEKGEDGQAAAGFLSTWPTV